MKDKTAFEKEEMGQASDEWDKTWGAMGQMRMPGLSVKTELDSFVADPEAPQQVRAGPNRVASISQSGSVNQFFRVSQSVFFFVWKATTGIKIPDRTVAYQTVPRYVPATSGRISASQIGLQDPHTAGQDGRQARYSV